jgi:hypothetical protein
LAFWFPLSHLIRRFLFVQRTEVSNTGASCLNANTGFILAIKTASPSFDVASAPMYHLEQPVAQTGSNARFAGRRGV